MIAIIKKSIPSGTVSAPPSKSFAHRALILGAFSDKSKIKNLSFSKDVEATLDCLKTLGAETEKGDGFVNIGGLKPEKIGEKISLACGESGSTLRFLIPVCLLTGRKIALCGTEKLLSRPLDEYEKICKDNGFIFEKSKDSVTVCGKIKAGRYSLRSDASSQFVTGLLLALSAIPGRSEISLSGEIESRPYIDITLKTMRDFGIDVLWEDEKTIAICGGKPENTEYTVEADASNAAYLEAFGLFGDVTVSGIKDDTVQGDIVYKKYFADLSGGKKEFDLKDCPDLAPVMFAACSLFGGARFTGTRRLAFKESDRVASMKEELSKFGAVLCSGEDMVEVFAEKLHAPSEPLFGHNDHRVVMALSLLCAKFGGSISGAEAVSKSFPDFFDKISELGIEVIKDA